MADDEHASGVFDIEESDEIVTNELLPVEFESEEIEIENVDWDDLEGLDENLLKTVKIVFVDDETVQTINTSSKESKKADANVGKFDEKLLICEKCNKRYKRQHFYKKHIEKCGEYLFDFLTKILWHNLYRLV